MQLPALDIRLGGSSHPPLWIVSSRVLRTHNSVALRANRSSRPLRALLKHAHRSQANGDRDGAPPARPGSLLLLLFW
eukprot:6197508-Pleurochrysis_carterae.AAC.4